jgi:hypothetical protein
MRLSGSDGRLAIFSLLGLARFYGINGDKRANHQANFVASHWCGRALRHPPAGDVPHVISVDCCTSCRSVDFYTSHCHRTRSTAGAVANTMATLKNGHLPALKST